MLFALGGLQLELQIIHKVFTTNSIQNNFFIFRNGICSESLKHMTFFSNLFFSKEFSICLVYLWHFEILVHIYLYVRRHSLFSQIQTMLNVKGKII